MRERVRTEAGQASVRALFRWKRRIKKAPGIRARDSGLIDTKVKLCYNPIVQNMVERILPVYYIRDNIIFYKRRKDP